MSYKLWHISFFKAKEQFFNFKKNGPTILKTLNYVAILMSTLKLFSVILTKHITLELNWPFIIYSLPLLLSVIIHILITKAFYNFSFFLAFYCIPASIILLGYFEQMTYLLLFQIAYGIVAFFVLQKKHMIISSYIFSAISALTLGIYEIIYSNTNYNYHIFFLTLNFCIFFIPFYFILGFIRGIIELKQSSIKEKQNILSIQNTVLEKQNKELIEQEHLIAIKHKSLMESTEYQNKIISILSHDIRVPIVSIKNILNSYSKQKINKESILDYLPEINNNIQYISNLFEDILSWSREQKMYPELKNENFCLRDISDEICNAYLGSVKSKKIKLKNNISESKIVYGNERYVKVILRNLISNAIKFTPTGGEICIDSKRVDLYDIIYVKDTGQGISQENLYKIRKGLEVSTKGTLNETGTGLGLYFCREFAQKGGGNLFVESEFGKGSVFSFTVPFIRKHIIEKAG